MSMVSAFLRTKLKGVVQHNRAAGIALLVSTFPLSEALAGGIYDTLTGWLVKKV